MAWMRLATSGGGLAYLELDAVESADGEGLVVSAVRFANASAHPMTFEIRRANNASVVNRTVNAGQAETTLNVPGSVANRTIRHISTHWGPV
jgi:hypothetical protein